MFRAAVPDDVSGHARGRDGELEGGTLECAVGGDGNKCAAAELSRGLRLCGGC